MANKNRCTKWLLLDPFMDGLLSPFIIPVVKFWVDQKIDPKLFGYALGAEALLTILFYLILERRQTAARKRAGSSAHVAHIPYTLVIIAMLLGYAPLALYARSGANAYFALGVVTGSFYFFCVRNHLAYIKRRLFSPEERELFDRSADKLTHLTSIFSMALLAFVFIEPGGLSPVMALATCFFLNDVGLICGFSYFYWVEERSQEKRVTGGIYGQEAK